MALGRAHAEPARSPRETRRARGSRDMSDETTSLPNDHSESAAELQPAAFSRREILQGSLLGAATIGTLGAPATALAQAPAVAKGTLSHYHVRATDKTVHWGYFSKKLPPVVTVNSGDFVTLETVTHHAN